jgi:hypothetical protein
MASRSKIQGRKFFNHLAEEIREKYITPMTDVLNQKMKTRNLKKSQQWRRRDTLSSCKVQLNKKKTAILPLSNENCIFKRRRNC